MGIVGVATCLVNSSNIPDVLLYFSNYFSMFQHTLNTLFLLGKFYLDYSTSNTSMSLSRQPQPAHFQPASFDSELTPWFEWSWHRKGMPGRICQLYGFKPLQCSYLMIYSKWGSDHLQCCWETLGADTDYRKCAHDLQPKMPQSILFLSGHCTRPLSKTRKWPLSIQPPPLAK